MAESNVIGIRPGIQLPINDPQADVVEMLDRALSRAKNGELTGVGIAIADADGGVSTEWAGGGVDAHGNSSRMALGSAISWLNARFFNCFSGGSGDS